MKNFFSRFDYEKTTFREDNVDNWLNNNYFELNGQKNYFRQKEYRQNGGTIDVCTLQTQLDNKALHKMPVDNVIDIYVTVNNIISNRITVG